MEGRDICNNCGKENPPGSKFCAFCGGPIAPQTHNQNLCPNCGAPLAEGVKFCNECGCQIGEPVPPLHREEPVEDGLFHDHTFGSDVRPEYDQRPADRSSEPPSMEGYYKEEKLRNVNRRPEKVKKQRDPKEAHSGSEALIIPIILFIIAAISYFFVTLEVTAAIALIAFLLLIVFLMRRRKKPRYDGMGY